jgi:hypothetical protein
MRQARISSPEPIYSAVSNVLTFLGDGRTLPNGAKTTRGSRRGSETFLSDFQYGPECWQGNALRSRCEWKGEQMKQLLLIAAFAAVVVAAARRSLP